MVHQPRVSGRKHYGPSSTHVAKALDLRLGAGAYQQALVFWSYATLPLLVLAVLANEGRSPNGVQLHAFKTWAHRLYGFRTTLHDLRSFVIIDCDPAKKRVKAKQNNLNRAKGRVDTFERGKLK